MQYIIKQIYSLSSLLVMVTFLGVIATSKTQAQTCSVNAGVPSSVCVSADSFMLIGNATGALATTAIWSLVSGPNIPVITSPTSLTSSVTGITAGTYIFSYTATCSDAVVVSDSVTVTVSALPVFTVGNDTTICGLATVMKATLPVGASGIWSYFSPTSSGATGLSFSSPASPTSNFNLSSFNAACPKPVYAIWTVTQGACTGRDTVIVSFGTQTATLAAVPDQALCGTTFTSSPYFYGCGGNLIVSQLSGPGTATITFAIGAPSSIGYTWFNITDMMVGEYIFAVEALRCTGTTFRDTFKLTIGSTVPVSNPSFSGKVLCPEQFDSVYYFEPATALLPGETMSWNLTPTNKFPGTLPNPVADTIGNILRLRNVLHPDTASASSQYSYTYSYTVNNGICSRTFPIALTLYTPLPFKPFVPTLNLACGATSTNIAQQLTGSFIAFDFRNIKVVTKPAGTINPTYTPLSTSTINVSDLKPGKYVFTFEYYRGNAGCEVKSATVEVNVAAAGGLANAGTNQILPCGVDSSTLAGNTPPIGQLGTWQLVSGPSTVVLTNPNSPSLLIKTLLPGAYTFRWAISNGTTCPATSDEMLVVVTPTAPVADAGLDKTVCYGYSTALIGTAFSLGSSGHWNQIGGPAVVIADSTASSTTISGTIASTVYTFTYTLSNVCGTDIDTVEITTGTSQGPSDAVISTVNLCLTTTSATLIAVAPATGTGGWSQLSGPSVATIVSPSSNTTSVIGLVGGEYKFIWQVTATGCDTLRDTISVAYRTGTITANAGLDRYVCKDTIHLNATSPTIGSGIWMQTSGISTLISDINSPTSSITGLIPSGIYDYRWTVKLGSCPEVSDDVHIVVSSPPALAKAMIDTTICGLTIPVGGQIILPIKADTPSSGIGTWGILESPYYYAVTSGIANVGAPNTTIAIVGGYYKLLWQVSNGVCPASYDTVIIDLVPNADAGAATLNICEKISQDFRGTEPGTGTALWSQMSGPSIATITNPTNSFTTIIDMIPGIYKFKYEVNHPVAGCSSFDTVIINNGERIIASAGNDSIFCWMPGSTTLYLKADTPSSGTGSWARTVGTGSLSYSPSATNNPTNAIVSASGLHQFRWTVTNGGCQSIDYKDIFVEQLTVPTINFSPLTACNDSFNVSVVSPYSNFSYAWSFPKARIKDTSGVNVTGPIANNFLISDTNNIFLTVTNPATGCFAKDSTAIIVDCAYLPLPLSLLNFEVTKSEYVKALLRWSTGVELNINKIEIDHSNNGTVWQKIAELNPKGSNSNYSFVHNNPVNGLNLYRLKFIEIGGAMEYSPIKTLNFSSINKYNIILYPNPASQAVQLTYSGASFEGAQIKIINSLGEIMIHETISEKLNTISINTSLLKKGLYIINIFHDGINYTQKLTIN